MQFNPLQNDVTCQIKFHSHFTPLCLSQVDSRTWGKQAVSDKTQEQEEHVRSTETQKVSPLDETCYYHSQVMVDSPERTPKILSLKVGVILYFCPVLLLVLEEIYY